MDDLFQNLFQSLCYWYFSYCFVFFLNIIKNTVPFSHDSENYWQNKKKIGIENEKN